MNGKPQSSGTGVLSRGDRAARLVAIGIAAYLTITLVPLFRHVLAVREVLPVVVHLATLAIVGASIGFRSAHARTLRGLMPLALVPVLYIDLRWLIAGWGRPHLDATIISWEQIFFPGDPSRTLALRFSGLTVSEVLHACYASYYVIVFVPPVLLYLRGRREEYFETTMALLLVFLTCFSCFQLFPVDGPRYLVGPADAPAGPIRAAVLYLLQNGSSRGTAFPSSHVAASVVATISALRHQRRVGYVVALLAAGLTISTVYGGFHYGVDALAGLLVGVLASGAAWKLWGAIPASDSGACDAGPRR